jgi:hypothetical protein
MLTSRRPNRNLRTVARRAAVEISQRAEVIARRHNWIELPPPSTVAGLADTPVGVVSAETHVLSGGQTRRIVDFNTLLHELRSIELARMPKTDGTVLSAGCSDASYFEWITRCYGPISRHIGVELYLPEPAQLPAGVEWIKNSVGNMAEVASDSIGLVFSGQNFEHLFGNDAVDFLLECHRVLKVGASLVIDSPNRTITGLAGWTHPEHTIEFTPSEAVELATLAGFDVDDVRGVWLCTDPLADRPLDLWPWLGSTPPLEEVLRRAALSSTNPDGSFVWWLEARRADRAPKREELIERYAAIYEPAWSERKQRVRHQVGTLTADHNETISSAEVGESGYLMFGPYMPLVPGDYVARYVVRRRGQTQNSAVIARVDVANVDGNVIAERILHGRELPADEWTTVELSFRIQELVWGGQIRMESTGQAGLDLIFSNTVERVQIE